MADIIARIDALLANTPPSEIEEFEVCRCLRDAKAEIERIFRLVSRAADDLSDLQSENQSLRSERQELWRAISDMKAAAETAGYVFRNTDSGPALVR